MGSEMCIRDSTCGQHTLDALNPGAEYLWSTGDTTQLVTVSSSGLFYVDVTVEKCTTRDSVMVDVNAAPIAGFTFTSNTGVVTFSNDSENAVHYQWHFGDGNQDFQKDPVHTYPESGVYTITLIAINNCGSDTVTEQVTLFISGIEDMNLDNNISIFPNPTSAVANVNFSAIDVNELTMYGAMC